jgi:sigma-B regulation protein RsbU (phosphoserine phosphatase)
MSLHHKSDLDPGFFLESLMKNSTDAIYFKDLESRFIMVNKTCFEKHGWPSAEAVRGRTDFDVFTKEHAEQAFSDEQKIIQTGQPLDCIEEKETWPDGSVSWVSTTKMPLKNECGEIIGTFGMSRDITKRKEMELRAERYAKEIRMIKEEMEDDVRMASELQKTFFPNHYPVYPQGAALEDQCIEFLHQFKSSGGISADYCSIQRLSDTQAAIFLCDVQGLGLRAALGTALVRGVVQEISPFAFDPGAYLSRMNDLLAPLLRQDGIPLDVKACYVVLDVANGHVKMATAGRLQSFLISQGGIARRVRDEQDIQAPALAAESEVIYPTNEFFIEPGDCMVLCTDGLCTAVNEQGQFYGEQRLMDSVLRHAAASLDMLFQSLEADAVSYSASESCVDDFCLVGFHLKQFMK